jgi:hypothetical protein
MLAALLCILVLLGALLVAHVRVSDATCTVASSGPPGFGAGLGLGAVLCASLPLLALAPGMWRSPPPLWGDLPSHARVAAEMARTGLPHGWIDSYVGGFPFGHHYPSLAWLLLAASIRLGASPAVAVGALGLVATLAFPLTVYLGLARCGAKPAFAALGACLLCWVSPYNAFVGGYETFFANGLMSQTFAMPLCTWLVVATLRSERRWEAPLLAWLSMASHPQVTVATLAVLLLSLLVSGQRSAISSGLWTVAYTLLAGASLYGQGITALDVPFGWPPDMGWRQFGFPPARLSAWLVDADLLDAGRAPVTTALLAAASLVLILGLRQASSRALVFALAASLVMAVSGRWLQRSGPLGLALLSFLQPLRVISLVPPLAAAVIAIGLQRGAERLGLALSALGRPRLAHLAATGVALVGLLIASFGLPSRLKYSRDVRAAQHPSVTCGSDAQQVDGYDRDEVLTWVASLSGGRLWYEAHQVTTLSSCLYRDGIELASGVPIGTAAAVGAHVGVLARAGQFVDPLRPGSSSRAEALGIGYLLLDGAGQGAPPGWVVRQRRGDVQLLEQPAQVVGVGCVDRLWSGSRERVRSRLNRDLANASQAKVLLDPHRFTAIEYAPGDLREVPSPGNPCDDRGATVSEVVAEAGEVSATVQATAPVDVVFRFSAFPTWRVQVDGAIAAPLTLVAPGFFSVRVPSGSHRLTAVVGLLPHYLTLIGVAAFATAALATCRGNFRLSAWWLEALRLRRR